MFSTHRKTPNGTARDDAYWMRLALKEAQKAGSKSEVPIGAIVVHENKVIARAHNLRESKKDPLGHAELRVLEKAAKKLGRWRLENCTLYVTLEPCTMCAGACVLSRVSKVVYGATDPKAGAAESLYKILSDPRLNHRPELKSGVLKDECGELLSVFFKSLRQKIKSKKQ